MVSGRSTIFRVQPRLFFGAPVQLIGAERIARLNDIPQIPASLRLLPVESVLTKPRLLVKLTISDFKY
jgi:hypothetical protein